MLKLERKTTLNFSIIFMILSWMTVLATSNVLAQFGEVIASFPSPGRKPTGLAWDGQYLWNADTGTNMFYQIDPTTGSVIKSLDFPGGAIINGLTWDGQYLWCSDREGDRLYKIDVAHGPVVQTIQLQTPSPRGMAFDGSHLWYQDSEERKIFKLNPISGTIVNTLDAPARSNRGLTWDGAYLWSTDYYQTEVYMIDPKRGKIITILSAPGSFPYGLAFDGEFLWNADYATDTIYKISIRGSEKYRISDPLQATIRYTVKVKNVDPTTMSLETLLACPWEIDYQRLERPIDFTLTPDNFFYDTYGQQIAYYEDTLLYGVEKVYQWSVPATLYNIRYFLHPDSVGGISDIPQSILDLYTADGDKYKITHPSIVAAAEEAIGDETNLYWQVRNIHDYVISHIYYYNDHRWDDAPTVLNQGHGSCSEYSFLFIALCRAAGIPARYEAGGHLRGSIPYEDRVFHRWQQVYFPNYGWIPIDCTWDDKEYPYQQAHYFGAASNHAFTTTIGGGGEYGLWWTYNSANSQTGGERECEKVMEWLSYTTDVKIVMEQNPVDYLTCINYPNPFNMSTTIRFELNKTSQVSLKIFNSIGRRVTTLLSDEVLPQGVNEIRWDASNHASGVYYYQLKMAEGRSGTGRMILLK